MLLCSDASPFLRHLLTAFRTCFCIAFNRIILMYFVAWVVRVCPVVSLYHNHHESYTHELRLPALHTGRGGSGLGPWYQEGVRVKAQSADNIATDGYKLSCMCLSLFLLSYCILFKFPTVRFLRLYRRHRFAIRNRNQLEGNSGV